MRKKRVDNTLSTRFFYYIGDCAQNVRIFACKIKAYLFFPQDWGIEGVEALKMLFYSVTLSWGLSLSESFNLTFSSISCAISGCSIINCFAFSLP